ncbi:hypothetical protein NA78x_004929 [Anatilimnocola sp. NA78]|uniref:hypothetical protein n=1 Tax=Anatilimnocola sp. NA78 TaxID=3415683 RepID=UPI003CE4DF2E
MPIEFACPTCQTQIRTPDTAAGKMARCPRCQTISAVPAASANSAPLADISFPVAPLANPSAPAWLPPSAAFQPAVQPQATTSNPFGELPGAPIGPADLQNPYSSPSGYAEVNLPFSRDQACAKLLIPAFGIALSALMTLVLIGLFFLMMLMDPGFQKDLFKPDPAETAGGLIALGVMIGLASAPSLIALLGAYAMFRGRGLVTAWLGTIAALIPCGPCIVFGAIFAVWGMIALSDTRVSTALR